MARAPSLVAALAALLLAPAIVEAAAPRLDWRTIVTPRFRIHYHEGLAPVAERLAPIAEAGLDRIAHLLGNMPDTPIHVVLTDETDSANGFAAVLPLNLITLYCAVPDPFGSLGDYDDFMALLFLHELTHVVHLDTIGGIARSFNDVFGKTLAPNHVQPRWFIEGIAVYAESKTTSGGRVKSALVDMYIREQILADRFWSIDEITTQTRRFPGGSIAWNIGGRFLDFIARRHGEAALATISREYGSRIVPYGLNLIARDATGEDYLQLWDAWRREQEEKTLAFMEALAARGVVEGERVLRPAEEVYHPQFGPGGELAIVEVPRDGDTELVILERGLAAERLRLRTSNGTGAFTPDGATYVAAISDTHAQAYSYTDLELIDVATGARRRRTYGARLDEPDVSPDGRTIVAVQQAASRTWLVTLSLDGDDAPRRIYTPPPGYRVASPVHAPDGRAIAFSLHTPDGGRRITELDLERRRRRDLTGSRSQDLDPVYAPDGARVYFASDRGGAFNIHAVEVGSRRITKITDVATGAFEPAIDPSGRVLAFVLGTADGYELRALALDAVSPRAPEPAVVRSVPTATVAAAHYPREPYAPWESLLPRAYLPTTGLDGLGDTIGVLVSGNDAVSAHGYDATLEYGLASKRINYSVAYYNRMLWTPITVSSSLVATSRPASFPALDPAEDRPESIFRARLSIDFPFGRWDGGYGFGLSYGIESRRGLNQLPDDPVQEAPPVSAADLFLASVAVSWRFSNIRYFADSISAAAGHALDISADLHTPELGSDLRLVSITGHWAGFLTMPWLEHHVLALRLAFGASTGDARGRATYALGGLEARNVLRDAVDEVRVSADVIRGYEVGAFRGNAFYLGAVEYRLPVFDIERGVDTFPVFADRVYAAAFVDAGDTPREQFDLDGLKVGTGAELRLDVVVGYYLPITARAGYARGLSSGGIHNLYLVLGGVF